MAERPKWHKPPKYQLGFDFGQQPLDPSSLDDLRFTTAVKETVNVRTPADAGQYLLTKVFTPFEAFNQEEVWVLLLNARNVITHQSMIYRGTINEVQMRIAEVFTPAVRLTAANIMVSHNHPSGDASPSPEDVRMNELLVEAGNLLRIPVLDHIIVGRECWTSLKQLGLGFAGASKS